MVRTGLSPLASRRAFLHTFGCQMNKLDSELLAGRLQEAGFTLVRRREEADLVVYNTCSVRQKAEEKVYSHLGELKRLKDANPDLVIAVVGCMAQREKDAVFARAAHVDIVCGTSRFLELPGMVERCRADRKRQVAVGEEPQDYHREVRHRPTPWSAFLAVMRGCNNFCSYCIVPYVRGREASRAPTEILEEARCLLDDGVQEITLLGQMVNAYGRDLTPTIDLADLLRQLALLPGLRRLEFITSHPRFMAEKLIRTMAEFPVISRYLHLPVQSGSDPVLKAMNRGYAADDFRRAIGLARELMPAAGLLPALEISSDFIVGFPGETDEDFAATAELLQWSKLLNAFIFKYSPRPGTAAAKLPDDVPLKVKKERNWKLLALQEEISRARHVALHGRPMEIVLTGPSKNDPGNWMGRSHANHIVVVPTTPGLTRGERLVVEITHSTPLTLFARPLPKETA